MTFGKRSGGEEIMSEWTKEERERAAGQVWVRDRRDINHPAFHGWLGAVLMTPAASDDGYDMTRIAIDLQCSLNRLQEEVREAHRIIQLAEPVAGIENNVFYGWCKDWLSRNK